MLGGLPWPSKTFPLYLAGRFIPVFQETLVETGEAAAVG